MNAKILADLRHSLAKLYEDELSMRRLVADSDLDASFISFDPPAINSWFSILNEAEKLGRVKILLGVVDSEYGSNDRFRNAYNAFLQSTNESDHSFNPGQISVSKDKLAETDINDLVKLAELARCEPNRWREELLLAGAKLCHSGDVRIWELVNALCFLDPEAPNYVEQANRGAYLAGQILVENIGRLPGLPAHQPKIDDIRRTLTRIVVEHGFSSVERVSVSCTLAALDEHWAKAMPIEDLQFCYIPAGPFYLSERDNKQIKNIFYDYCISRYPLTNAQYALFVKAKGYEKPEFWSEAIEHGYWCKGQFKGHYDDIFRASPVVYETPFKLATHPVVGISWFEARAFCRWLTKRLRTKNSLSASWEIRLPTAREWEKAARGGVEIPVTPIVATGHQLAQQFVPARQVNPYPQRRYPWGNHGESSRSNCAEEGIGSTSPVGCFPAGASPYGVEDLSGNAWEWMMNSKNKEWCLIKSRAYHFGINDVTIDPRTWIVPFRRNALIGFRVSAGPIISPA